MNLPHVCKAGQGHPTSPTRSHQRQAEALALNKYVMWIVHHVVHSSRQHEMRSARRASGKFMRILHVICEIIPSLGYSIKADRVTRKGNQTLNTDHRLLLPSALLLSI